VATVHDFAWSDYCDWYLEMVKVDLRSESASEADRARAWTTASEVLAGLLRLLHPIMPFVTEAVWQSLAEAEPQAAPEPLLVSASWPSAGARDADTEVEFAGVAALVRGIRNLRTEAGAAAGAWLPITISAVDDESAAALERNRAYVEALTRARPVEVQLGPRPPASTPVATSPLGAAWLNEGVSAVGAASVRTARAEQLRRGIDHARRLLADEAFVAKAPPPVVARERARLQELETQLRLLEGQ
jgi:valyl-tRNA synthetase